MQLVDTFARPLRNLRLSVTDRCNLRCAYCMPEKDYVWLPREDVLRFEEISTLVDVFVALGVNKLRLTGGEPLLRRDLPALVQMLAAKAGLTDLAMTTNGVLLAEHADALRTAGLGRITVSLDTLRPDRFTDLTRFDSLDAVLEGMDAASRAFGRFKIDSVIIRGVNDDELADLIEYGRSKNAEVRFIEYMDVGGATRWSPADVVSRADMLERLAGPLRTDRADRRSLVGARGSLYAARRHGVRHHLLDDGPVLRKLRSQPPDRRRAVVSLPVRGARHRSARGAAPRRDRGRIERAHRGPVAGAHRSRRRGSAGARRTAGVRPHHGSAQGSPSRDAYERRVTLLRRRAPGANHADASPRLCRPPPAACALSGGLTRPTRSSDTASIRLFMLHGLSRNASSAHNVTLSLNSRSL